jgi:hypothetical protein
VIAVRHVIHFMRLFTRCRFLARSCLRDFVSNFGAQTSRLLTDGSDDEKRYLDVADIERRFRDVNGASFMLEVSTRGKC